MTLILQFCAYLTLFSLCSSEEFLFGQFPTGFKWGISSGELLNEDSTSWIASDVAALQALGVTSYRVEIDWLLNGVDNPPSSNSTDLAYYKELATRLRAAGIDLHVTLFNRQFPYGFEDTDSWDPCGLATQVFQRLGDEVSMWTTFSDPGVIAFQSSNPFEMSGDLISLHQCIYNAFQDGGYTGGVGIDIGLRWYEPARDVEQDVNATERARGFEAAGFARQLTSSVDFFGVIYEGSYSITYDETPGNFLQYTLVNNPEWDMDGVNWNPAGLRYLLEEFVQMYPDIPVYVSSLGLYTSSDVVQDKMRVEYLRYCIDEVLRAVSDGLSVSGINVFSFLDDMSSSFTFGLFERTEDMIKPRASGVLYSQLIADNGFEPGYNGLGGFPSGPVMYEDSIYYDQFPDDFAWSTATSAYQIEGGWDADGKGPSIWDTRSHSGVVYMNATGDIADDSYHKYMDDVEILSNLGTKYYRFSIAWTRLMPEGTKDNINQAGIDYYNNLIDALLAAGITPMVTLFHWDLPQALQDNGGWLNESTVDAFRDYAELCYTEFGDRVKYWITFNEPKIITLYAYGTGAFPPAMFGHYDDVYLAAHNLIKAHAEAYHVYDKSQNGWVGITVAIGWAEPADMYNPEDLEAAERDLAFDIGWFIHPIYINGDYPDRMKAAVAQKSAAQGYSASRLPEFTESEKQRINGTFDFYGLNFYSAHMVTAGDDSVAEDPNYWNDKATNTYADPEWLGSGSEWLKVTPFGLRKVLNWLKYNYNNVPVYITENGVSDRNGTLKDYHRIHFYRSYINEVLKAIRLDGVNVRGYTAWSLMDNFEWNTGYSERFGIHYVNFSDPERTRVPKGSAYWYQQLIAENGYVPGYPGVGGRGTAPDYVGKMYYGMFPDGFDWGVGTYAYQVEGAWDQDGKGASIMDTWAQAGNINGGDTGDIAADSYNNYMEDVQLVINMGLDSYQFSISWSRIFPSGTGDVNQAGLDYYSSLIDAVVAANIRPVVILYAFDLPQALEDNGGWLNDSTIQAFVEYADACFMAFGDRVERWITITDPLAVALQGYGTGEMAPGVMGSGTNDYIVANNLLRAHAGAYRQYQSMNFMGQVGIALTANWAEPMDEFSPADWWASERVMQFTLGLFANPIFGDGDYPQVVKDLVGDRLPMLSADDMTALQGSADFLGVSFHGASRCLDMNYTSDDVSFEMDSDAACVSELDGESLRVAPWALRKTLNWVRNNYSNVTIYVSANGVSENTASIGDYQQDSINEVLKAISLDGIDVMGYTAYSLLDGLDWLTGYSERYGLYNVDYGDPARTRSPKPAAVAYSHIADLNGFKEVDFDVYIPYEYPEQIEGTFPDGFLIGTASASYQIEGAWNTSGKGPSIWDTFAHEGGHIYNNDTGDVAADGYGHYMEDIRLIKALNVPLYRFSIAWTRLYPSGYGDVPNQAGVDFYNNFIDALLDIGVEPLVTLYHWDLPQGVQDYGGWLNESNTDAFASYADTCFRLFGDRVKRWLTLNEPWVCSKQGFEDGSYAPGHITSGTEIYQAGHNLILGHAKAWRVYDNTYRATQHGRVGITLNCDWWEPFNPDDPADWQAKERAMDFHCGWFKHPIFVDGDYPPTMREYVDRKSAEQGLSESRLPVFSEEQKAMIKGSADFLGLNHYTTTRARYRVCDENETGYYCDMELEADQDPNLPTSGSVWLRPNPPGFRRLLNYIKDTYNNVPVFVTENGVTDNNGTTHDGHRIWYYHEYMNELLKAVTLDGCNVEVYVAWAIVDFFEWSSGFHEKFGFFHVDLNDPTRPRSSKESALWFRNMVMYGYTNLTIPHEDDFLTGTFPDDFVWAVATASYQIEGAYDEDGKGPNIWDTFVRLPGAIYGNDTGDVATDSYHKYTEDVNLLRALKVTHYRFSISWSRIMPDGVGAVNQAGIDYYNNLIDMLLAAGITPMVTLYHWDLPQYIETNYGGWPNRSVAELFENYADVCFREFGDRVKFWITLNEPWCVAFLGYGNGQDAPGIVDSGIADYEAAHTLILAHARAYRLYERKYKRYQGGRISVTLNSDWASPRNASDALDVAAAERRVQFHLGWFAKPIYVDGEYPPIMRFQINKKSEMLNITEERLPRFTEAEKRMIIGSHDFFGLNSYTTVRSANVDWGATRDYYNDMDVAGDADPSWPGSGSSWLYVVPWGIRRLLNFIRREYGDNEIYITENGVSDNNGTLQDDHRIYFYKHYTNEVLKAINVDGIKVRGYTAWSLLDNFEWSRGYSEYFGLHAVDMTDPERPRTPKASASFYRELILRNGFPELTPAPQMEMADEFLYGSFPDGFAWSVATASYQIEGAWDEDGKGESIWDRFSHDGRVKNNDTGDIACDAYHKYLGDVDLLEDLGVTHYRFSVAWTRILPDGTKSMINDKGIEYYNNLINALLDKGITPMVTMNHWDLPQGLEDNGGWVNSSTADHFVDYADVLFENFGDRVKLWITHNEPWVISVHGYETGEKAPGRTGLGYEASHQLIRAHGMAYKLYNDKYRATQNGSVGITLNHSPGVPKNPTSLSDIMATDVYNQFGLGWFAEPIFGSGDYPDVMRWQVGNKSLEQGYSESRLPEFTDDEKKMLKGSSDFFGYNIYTAVQCTSGVNPLTQEGYFPDQDVATSQDPSWPGSASFWLKVTPWAMRVGLNWIKDQYNNIPVYVTENGISDTGGLNDTWRIDYYNGYINEMLKAIQLDACDVRGYTAWSFMDNFEWQEGYSERFGLYYVDFDDPDRPRTAKASASFYSSVIQNNGFPSP